VALRIWADCLSPNDSGSFDVRAPAQPPARDLDSASQNVLLVLRAIAQSEQITERDIADNLRLPQGAVSSAVHYSVLRGWIEEIGDRYRLSWQWFRTINRVLARKNLLAR
jgi:DNA-binding IclR family transcriptional regulator